MSCIGFMSSTNCTFGSMTQRSGRGVSKMNPTVRDMSPTKMDDCCVMIREVRATPNIMAKNLPLFPISILSAMRYTLRVYLVIETRGTR